MHYEEVKAFWRRKHDGSDDGGTLLLFLAQVLYCSNGGKAVKGDVEFYRSNKTAVDRAAQVPYPVQSGAPVHFFRPIHLSPPSILLQVVVMSCSFPTPVLG